MLSCPEPAGGLTSPIRCIYYGSLKEMGMLLENCIENAKSKIHNNTKLYFQEAKEEVIFLLLQSSLTRLLTDSGKLLRRV